MQQKSRTYSFSAHNEDQVWLEGLRGRIEGKVSFSQAIIDSLKDKYKNDGKSPTRVRFEAYCLKNYLHEEQQLEMIMTAHRVCNGMEDDDA